VEQLHGRDVIVAHRLLKNTVPSKEYLLVTEAVLARLPDESRARFIPHREEFDLGAISGGYREIAQLWTEAEAAERKRVEPSEALVTSDITVEAPLKIVYEQMLKPDVMQRYLFSDGVESIPGARGEMLATEFHCHHGGEVVTMRVVSVEKDRELTLRADKPTPMHITTSLTADGAGRTRLVRAFLWEQPADPEFAANLREAMAAIVVAGEGELKSVFARIGRRTEAARPDPQRG
jgi:uncharacterized protein YndB with AHSA1/START domain